MIINDFEIEIESLPLELAAWWLTYFCTMCSLLPLWLFCSLDNVLQLLLIIVSNFGDERDEILPIDVPLRLRQGAADK